MNAIAFANIKNAIFINSAFTHHAQKKDLQMMQLANKCKMTRGWKVQFEKSPIYNSFKLTKNMNRNTYEYIFKFENHF